jgi:hypothetical protein
MAKELASRLSGDEASSAEVRERAERAAAFIPSIHERWASLAAAEAAPVAARDESSDVEPAPETTRATGLPDASEPEAGAVSVAPILGITTDADDEDGPRPRFKTLMGVPRSSPEIDDLAGLEDEPPRLRDTVRLERRAARSAPAQPLVEAPPPSAKDEPSLTATSWPWERNAPPAPARSVAPQWAALVEGSLDVSAEVAALRSARTRRPWLIALAAVVAAVALFCVAAPRERKLAWRWAQREYRARMHAGAELTDTARALRPATNVVEPASTPAPAVAALEASAPADPLRNAPSNAAPIAEPATTPVLVDAPSVAEPSSTVPAAAAATEVAALESRKGASNAPQAKSSSTNTLTKSAPKPRASAPRKRSTKPVAAAAGATKPRATRQNSPKKPAGDGIIRQTPF